MNVLLDTNIFFNIWRKEVDDNGKQLWKGSKDLIDKLLSGQLEGFISIITLMEIALFLEKRVVKPENLKKILKRS